MRVCIPVRFPLQSFTVSYTSSPDMEPAAFISSSDGSPPAACPGLTRNGFTRLSGIRSDRKYEAYVQQTCLKPLGNDVLMVCSRCSGVLGKGKPGLRPLPLSGSVVRSAGSDGTSVGRSHRTTGVFPHPLTGWFSGPNTHKERLKTSGSCIILFNFLLDFFFIFNLYLMLELRAGKKEMWKVLKVEMMK